MSTRRLPTEGDAAAALLAQALASGHYFKTPADEQCPSGVWMLVPLDRRLVQILDLAGADQSDLEDDEREADVADEEPSLGSSSSHLDQEQWSAGGTGIIMDDVELDCADDEPGEPGEGETLLSWAPDWRPWTFPPSEEIAPST